jgi:adenosine deaminase
VHAGRQGPPSYVRRPIGLLRARPIDDGNRALEDTDLVARIAREQIPITVCPLSNPRLQVCLDLAAHPLRRMLVAVLLVTMNSDDPSLFRRPCERELPDGADSARGDPSGARSPGAELRQGVVPAGSCQGRRT